MDSQAATHRIARFGAFEADLSGGLLTRKGLRIRIEIQPFRVLTLLLERPGEIVTREEIHQQLWPTGTYVDFEGSLNAALKKLRAALNDDPKKPRFIETVPKRGYRLIVPVTLASLPAGQASQAPAGPSSRTQQNPRNAVRRSIGRQGIWLRWRFVAFASLLLVVLPAVLFLAHPRSGDHSGPVQAAVHPRKERPSVAVLGFRNLSEISSAAWLDTALSEMLSTELAGGGELRLASGEDVANLRRSSPWPEAGSLDATTAARIGVTLDSDYLVLGSYTVLESSLRGRLRIDACLQDARTGEILAEAAAAGSRQNLFLIVSELGEKLRRGLGVPALNQSEEIGLLATSPLDPGTAQLYALGLEKLRAFDALSAKDLLEQATETDPKFPLAHAMLARAWGLLGYEQKRKEEIRKAFQLSADLPHAERMLVEGDYYDSLGEHEKAASVYRALFELYPDDVEFGLRLAAAERGANRGSQARETLRRLRQLRPPASLDPRIDLAEAWFATSKAAELALIRNAMNKALSQGKRLIYADARRRECLTLNYSDHPERAPASCEEAYKIFIAAGNRLAAADSVRLLADRQGGDGHYEQAIATYQRALGILEGLGEHEKTGTILNNMAINFENEGKLDRAELLYRQAKSNFEEAGDKANVALGLGNIADILYERGNLDGAARLYEEALQIIATLDPARPGYPLYRLASLELTKGRVQEARAHAEAAVKAFPLERGSYGYLTGAMLVLGDVMIVQGDLAGAQMEYEHALAIRRELGAKQLVAENQEELAELALEEGHPERAEQLLRAAIAEFESDKGEPDACIAYTVLSRALLAEGELDEARSTVRHALELSRSSSDPALKLAAAIQEAYLKIADATSHLTTRRDFSEPHRELQRAILTAKRLGYYRLECEARLALGELELHFTPAIACAHLRLLEEQSHSRGMDLISRKAAQLMKPSLISLKTAPETPRPPATQ
jgi:DNA-binding winged helix-turn-helix (wHTH) protein/tetratricopeptide (TPR) repeat protein